jgi:hypothetical protein
MNHVTVGVYPSGDYKVNVVREEDLESHIEYNLKFRPGRLFFVDGKAMNNGLMKEEYAQPWIQEWTEKIKNMNIDTSTSTRPYR